MSFSPVTLAAARRHANTAGSIRAFNHLAEHRLILEVGGASDFDQFIREIGNVVEAGNAMYLCYSGYQSPYADDDVYVGFAKSTDGGATWTKLYHIDTMPLEDPYLVKSGGTFYLFAEDKGTATPGRGVRLLTNPDVENAAGWTDHDDILPAGETGEWDAFDTSSPTVWVEDGSWHMLYEGRGGANTGAVGYATSDDGLTWSKHPNNPVVAPKNGFFTGTDVDIPWASSLVPDDVIKLGSDYYLALHAAAGPWYPAVLRSTDLITWDDVLGGPITGLPRDVDTVMFAYLKGEYRLLWGGKIDLPPGPGIFSSLPTVRSAAAFAELEAWQDLPLGSGWSSSAGTFAKAQYRREPGGLVRLRGTVNGGSAQTLGILPEGYRPEYTMDLPIERAGEAAYARVFASNGNINILSAASGSEVVRLDGIVFPAVP